MLNVLCNTEKCVENQQHEKTKMIYDKNYDLQAISEWRSDASEKAKIWEENEKKIESIASLKEHKLLCYFGFM